MGRKPPLGTVRGKAQPERRESATSGHSECLTSAFSTSALGLETLLVNGLIDRDFTIEFTGLWVELLDATLPTERDSGLCAPHFPTFG